MKRAVRWLLVFMMAFALCGCEESEDTPEFGFSETVYRTKTGECYHLESCYHLKTNIKTTVDEAKSMGLKPCLVCNPPE